MCYCYKGNFPGKNIRKDDEENNLYVLTDEQEVTVYLEFNHNDFRKKFKFLKKMLVILTILDLLEMINC